MYLEFRLRPETLRAGTDSALRELLGIRCARAGLSRATKV
jgi:hypothetical protein